MTACLHLKARVARSLIAIAFFLLTAFPALSQTKSSAKITCALTSVRFDHVVDFLSKSTGMNFIYSSNKIEASRPVSLLANNKALDEVLSTLGKELNLSFKIEGQHVLIKTVVLQPKKAEVSTIINTKKKLAYASVAKKPQTISEQTEFIENPYPTADPNFVASNSNTIDFLPADTYLKKQLIQLQPYFDSTFLKHVPARYIQSISKNNLHTGWFMSAGPLVNDYSNGLEIQAGLRSIYAVFSPTWLRQTGEFHGAYGLGTSINLKRNFSVNLAYLYASINRQDNDYYSTINTAATYIPCSQRINHHQIKLMIQYAFAKNLNIKTGFTFNENQVRTTYLEAIQRIDTHGIKGPGGIGAPPQHETILIEKHSQFTNRWLGWEASLSYKINFIRKP